MLLSYFAHGVSSYTGLFSLDTYSLQENNLGNYMQEKGLENNAPQFNNHVSPYLDRKPMIFP